MLRPYSEIFLPVAIVDPEITGEQTVSDLYEMGYRGLKMIGVKRLTTSRTTSRCIGAHRIWSCRSSSTWA